MWAELADQALQGHAVLHDTDMAVAKASIMPDTVLPSLDHPQEDLAGLAVFEETDGQVALVAGDAELVRDRLALVRQPAANGLDSAASSVSDALVLSGWVRFDPSR